jgi:hypothetical protein
VPSPKQVSYYSPDRIFTSFVAKAHLISSSHLVRFQALVAASVKINLLGMLSRAVWETFTDISEIFAAIIRAVRTTYLYIPEDRYLRQLIYSDVCQKDFIISLSVQSFVRPTKVVLTF